MRHSEYLYSAVLQWVQEVLIGNCQLSRFTLKKWVKQRKIACIYASIFVKFNNYESAGHFHSAVHSFPKKHCENSIALLGAHGVDIGGETRGT